MVSKPRRLREAFSERWSQRRDSPTAFTSWLRKLKRPLVASTTLSVTSRGRAANQCPMTSSDTPLTYTLAVSTRLPPASTKESRMAKASASGVSEPKYIVPRAIFPTAIPVLPSLRCNMANYLSCESQGAGTTDVVRGFLNTSSLDAETHPVYFSDGSGPGPTDEWPDGTFTRAGRAITGCSPSGHHSLATISQTTAFARTAKDSEVLGENQLPGQGTRWPLKWPLEVGGNPTAVEISRLRHHSLFIYPTLVHHAGIER